MHRVYCDTGAYRRELSELESKGWIAVYQFKYENRNRRIRRAAVPSRPTFSEMNYTWNELKRTDGLKELAWNDYGRRSEKFLELESIVGTGNSRDVKHLDSAYATGCSIFLTSDKADIWSKREQIKAVTGMVVMHFRMDWPQFVSLVPP